MKRILIIAITILINVGCDQISKKVVRVKIESNERIEVLGDLFILTKVENKGAFLGMWSQLPEYLRVILLSVLPTLAVLWFIIYLIRDKKMSIPMVVGVSFMLGGGIGNLYDRIVYGSVTDFMHIDLGFTQTGIFNAADVSIMVGGFFVLLLYIMDRRKLSSKTQDI